MLDIFRTGLYSFALYCRFYLSFENSFCSGYVTEKFYKALSISVVPIVMGGADYAARAPPRSYINVLDYESPQELAEYLLHLASHEEEYQQYFWWKVSTNIIQGHSVRMISVRGL